LTTVLDTNIVLDLWVFDDPRTQGLRTALYQRRLHWIATAAMREELRSLWTRTNVSADQLVADLQAWCKKAEESGIAELQSFAIRLRASQA
jgi:hypothetical protein